MDTFFRNLTSLLVSRRVVRPSRRLQAPESDAGLRKGHQSAGCLVPKDETDTAQALPQGKTPYASQLRILAEHIVQSVERDAADQMMNMMDAEVRRGPSQDGRQLIMGTPV